MLSVAVLVFTDKEIWQDAENLSPGGEQEASLAAGW